MSDSEEYRIEGEKEEYRIEGEQSQDDRNRRLFMETNTLVLAAVKYNQAMEGILSFTEMKIPCLSMSERLEIMCIMEEVTKDMRMVHRIYDRAHERFMEKNRIPHRPDDSEEDD